MMSKQPDFTIDIKQPIMDNEKGDTMFIRTHTRRHRPAMIGFGVVALCYLLWSSIFRFNIFPHPCDKRDVLFQSAEPILDKKALVPLEAHIMSKCPDAQVSYI
jgi:hypothetical protein